ncbi:hypothetical protein PHYPO_G00148020 [Pangasianodon hypophthalmus]|uniref:Ig-like domain-containing protein n=1 Tax=Pangasianodon hypophthalmus TaxID=310915 RepID=A0A5N5K9Z5_PANHP|nr:hypothetical protein PHYPO_G00148020 [Pangasianodon hypophthalmus]
MFLPLYNLSLRGDAAMLIRKRHFSAAAILMLLAGVQAQHSVTLFSQSLCAVTGSTVNIPCTYSGPTYLRQSEWYRVQGSEGEPQDLNKDPQYSGRVSVNSQWSSCELTLRNVSVSDSGVYNFRFKVSQRRDWISASSGVHLTVTDLQVKVDPNTAGQREVKVTCSSTCRLSTSRFYWYRNGQFRKYATDASIVLDSTRPSNAGSYSCRVYESSYYSPPACVLGKECWGVTYTPDRVCALKTSSIDLSCAYKHPAGLTVIKSVWFIKEQVGVEPVDVRDYEEYQDRVQYTQSSQNDCSLRITNLRERDAQTYRFRFYTAWNKYTGRPGVTLTVTDLKVTESDWRRASALSNRSEEYRRNDSAPVYGNVSATTSDPTQTASSEDQDNVQYSSVYFRHSHVQEVPLYSTVQLPKAQEEEVEYATVSLVKSRAVRQDKIYNNLKSKE